MICEECCQYYNLEHKCLCDGGKPSAKKIGSVKGCIVFLGSKRCKSHCETDEMVCDTHLKKGIENDNKFLSKLFG